MYAIQVSGYGKKRRYVVCRVENGIIFPQAVAGIFKMQDAAQNAALAAGIKVDVIGDAYAIWNAERRKEK